MLPKLNRYAINVTCQVIACAYLIKMPEFELK